MSNHEWEHGTFKLPSAEFASFRQTMQDHDQRVADAAFTQTQDFWKGLSRRQQTDPEAYKAALSAREEAYWRAKGNERQSWRQAGDRRISDIAESARERADSMLYNQVSPHHVDGKGWVTPSKPSRVKTAEAGFPTNRSTAFHDGEATVSFDKNDKTVTWDVAENNHAVSRAHESPLGRVFFKRLNQTRWTHGTGGVMSYNSEYNTDSRDVGRGENRCSGAYGYVGLDQEPTRLHPFVNAKGDRVEQGEMKWGRGGWTTKPKITKGVAAPVTPAAKKPTPAAPAKTATGTARAKTTAASNTGSFATRVRGEADGVDL